MSTCALAHDWEKLATKSILPLGTFQTAPWRVRVDVDRNVTLSTVPRPLPESMSSPTLSMSSIFMNTAQPALDEPGRQLGQHSLLAGS